MSVLAWIVVSGLAMSALALVGSIAVVLPERHFRRLVLPLVALAAGSWRGLLVPRPGAVPALAPLSPAGG